ncbi:MAG: metal dependent phosphohydrolase [uncultured bacterium]|nr:MAG: metal dependent phosphohydrolase [uncultured bacterium]
MIHNIEKIITLLGKGMANRKLYYADHPQVHAYGAEIINLTNNYFTATGAEELFIGIIDGFFVFEGTRLFGSTGAGKQLIQFAESLHCGGFGLQRGLALQDLKKFFDITALRSLPVKKTGDARALFADHGIRKIRIGDPYSKRPDGVSSSRSRVWAGQSLGGGDVQSPSLLYRKLFDAVSRAYTDAAAQHNLNIDETRSVSEFMLRYIQSSFADAMQHVHYLDYDKYTVGHSVRVSTLAVYIGTKMNWPEKDLLAMGAAGLLHDIGKSKIPDTILLKKGRLNEEEFAVIRNHPQAGVEILLEQQGVSALDLAACWGHHIRHDGGGYPRQPSWAVRHPVTALLQICDVFEALTAVRPYKDALDPQRAYAIMLDDKGGFHPGLLAAFIAAVGLYPPGTCVQLSDKRVGMVTAVGGRIDRPVINIVTSEHGEPLGADDQYRIDLMGRNMEGVGVEKLLLTPHPSSSPAAITADGQA